MHLGMIWVDDRLVCRSICSCIPDGHLHRLTYTRCRIDTINFPDDGHIAVRNMKRFFLMPPHVLLVDFVVLPPGHGRSVTDFWGWDAHEAQLRCPHDVWVVIEGDVVPEGALNLNSTNLSRSWSPRDFSPSRKTPTVEPGIETGTSWLEVRDSDH